MYWLWKWRKTADKLVISVHPRSIVLRSTFHNDFFWGLRHKKKMVDLLYIRGLVGIYTTIYPPQPRIFLVLGRKIPSGRPVPSRIFLPWTKNNLGFGAISLYIALRDPIYTLYIYIYIYIYILLLLSLFGRFWNYDFA